MMYWEAAAASRPASKLKSYWLFIFFTARMGERLRKLFVICIYTITIIPSKMVVNSYIFIYIIRLLTMGTPLFIKRAFKKKKIHVIFIKMTGFVLNK